MRLVNALLAIGFSSWITGCFYDFEINNEGAPQTGYPQRDASQPPGNDVDSGVDAMFAFDANTGFDAWWNPHDAFFPDIGPRDTGGDEQQISLRGCNGDGSCPTGLTCVHLYSQTSNGNPYCVPADPCTPMKCTCIHYSCFPGACTPNGDGFDFICN